MEYEQIKLKQDQVLCREGDKENDLYIIESGELLVCIRKGSQVTPIAYLSDGEYIGELSFFDDKPRGADIIALKPTTLMKIPAAEVRKNFPSWMGTLGHVMSSKIRKLDDVIRQKGIKKASAESIKPLDVAQQTKYFQILSK